MSQNSELSSIVKVQQALLKVTPLNGKHREIKARMVDFGGWDMPVQYSGVIDEHKAVRSGVGIFDVSHMGEISVTGRGALDFLQKMSTNDLSKLEIGQAQYSALCYESGTIVDDIITYRRGYDSFFICVNASNADKDFSWLMKHKPSSGVNIDNLSDEYAQIAVQGPKSRELLQEIVDIKIADLKYYHFAEGKIFGVPGIIARTGYTGELGYEIYIPANMGAKTWENILTVGAKWGVKPCGLGARDTLRLEVGYLLYGNDMDDTTTALEAGLGWVTKFEKPDFVGKAALLKQKENGLKRRLVGIEMIDKAIARHGYSLYATEDSSESIGTVTSGTLGPTVSRNIGMAYLPQELSSIGSEFFVDIRGQRKKAKVVKKPFYTNGSTQS